MMGSKQEHRPRLMLVEDDPISRGFFLAALESLPAVVSCADSIASALARGHERYDLWLIDVNLPDGSGSQLLKTLRLEHPETPAIAHTAEAGAAMHAQLGRDGFSDVLIKPLSTDRLLQSVRRALARNRTLRQRALELASPTLDWDEAAALAALNGQQHHLLALRELFLAELPGTRDAVETALLDSDEQALRSHLHRLQASCGFVGASRLAGAVRELRGDPQSKAAQSHFHDAVAALLP